MTDATGFFSCDGQNVAGLAHAHAVDGEHAKVVLLGRTQISQSQLSQFRICDFGTDCGIPGCCATRMQRLDPRFKVVLNISEGQFVV